MKISYTCYFTTVNLFCLIHIYASVIFHLDTSLTLSTDLLNTYTYILMVCNIHVQFVGCIKNLGDTYCRHAMCPSVHHFEPYNFITIALTGMHNKLHIQVNHD